MDESVRPAISILFKSSSTPKRSLTACRKASSPAPPEEVGNVPSMSKRTRLQRRRVRGCVHGKSSHSGSNRRNAQSVRRRASRRRRKSSGAQAPPGWIVLKCGYFAASVLTSAPACSSSSSSSSSSFVCFIHRASVSCGLKKRRLRLVGRAAAPVVWSRLLPCKLWRLPCSTTRHSRERSSLMRAMRASCRVPAVGHLAAAELELDPDLVCLVEELFTVAQLGDVVVLVDIDPKLDFLEFRSAVLGGVVLLGRLVFEFAVIDDSANWGSCHRRYLDEVQAYALCVPQGILQPHDTELLPGGSEDYAHFARANPIIDANLAELDIFFWWGGGLGSSRPALCSFSAASHSRGVSLTSHPRLRATRASDSARGPALRIKPMRQRGAFKQESGTRK